MEAISQFRDLGDLYWTAVEVFRALVEDPFQHESHRDAARGGRRNHAPSGGYRQLEQRVQTAKPPPLGLVHELTLEMRRRQVDDRLAQLKSRRVNRASNLTPASRKFSAAPSKRSTTLITFTIWQSSCLA